MASNGITRRDALALGVTGGLGGLLLGPRAANATATARAPAAVSHRGLPLPAGAAPGAGRAGTVVRTPAPFDLVGLRGVDLRGAHAEVRVHRARDGWSPWVPLGAGSDHAPDHPRAAPASDPVWAGGADALQLRSRRALRGGRLQLVSVPAAAVPRSRAVARAAAASPRQAAAPVIIPRDQWGAAQVPPRADPSYGVVNLAFVHHTVNANDYAPEDSARIVLAIARYHRDSNGWNDIGYNFLVDRYGQVFEGRAGGIDQAVIGAQAGGWNSKSTGVATIGDFGAVAAPEAALNALARLLSWKLALHGVPPSGTVTLVSGGGKENRYPYGTTVTLQRISGHRDGCNTDCPGAVLYGQLDDLRARVVAYGTAPVAPARVTLTAAASSAAYGTDVVLTGTARQTGGAAAVSVPVSIQKRTSKGGWVRVTTARTRDDGSFEARVPWTHEAPLRAVAQLPKAGGGRIRSTLLSVGLDPVLTVTAPGARSRVLAGASAGVQGVVGPAAPVRVTVERQDGRGRWVAAGSVRADVSKTTFAAAVPLLKPGLYRLTAAGGGLRAAPVYVRAVRSRTSLPGGQGGVSAPAGGGSGASAAGATGGSGGVAPTG